MQLQSSISSKIKVDNEYYLYFGGTAYLSIPHQVAFREHYLEGLKRFGINNGTSRANNVQLSIYNEAESFAASYFGMPDSLITSSGYLAAQLTVNRLSQLGEVRYAPNTHPALWINEAPETSGTFVEWANALVLEINARAETDWVIISNSLNNLHPEIYSFSFLNRIHTSKRIILIVDDSHGIGLINGGKGVVASLPKRLNLEAVVVASMAKALGVDAGLVLSSSQLISQLKNTKEYLGASPPSAAGLFAFTYASTIYTEELAKLQQVSNRFSSQLEGDPDWLFIKDFPVFLSRHPKVDEVLKKQRILISSFAYPDKNGSLINRIVLTSTHSYADIEELILALPKSGG